MQVDDIEVYTRTIRTQVVEKLQTETGLYWQEAFERELIPAGVVRFKDEILDDEQCWDNEYLVRLEHKEVGGMTVVAPPVKFEQTPLAVAGPTPVLGEHTREVFVELGLSEEELQALLDENKIRSST